jgi:hypothetical protein
MILLQSPRLSGKTTRCIELLEKNIGRVLLTFSKQEEQRLEDLYPHLRGRIFYWENWKSSNKFKINDYSQRIIVDNADYILQKIVGGWVEIGTFNEDTLI